MKKDLLILLLGASTAVALMFCLISLRMVGDHQARVEKLERELYVESLKRDYFEWRDGTAIGHAPNVKFSRQKELDALNNN
jgi:hypothetical protein